MKNRKILLPLVMMPVGFILNGIAWSENIGGPFISTICLCLGLGLLFFGFILFIVRLRD
jgi:Zn-dependent protease with chaperone function